LWGTVPYEAVLSGVVPVWPSCVGWLMEKTVKTESPFFMFMGGGGFVILVEVPNGCNVC